jgi:tripartite-type tricarboxylate transporter receptor subunit TctC
VITAMLGGQIQAALLPPALASAQARSGKLKLLATTATGRSILAPEVPSLAEAGVKDYQLEIWNAVAAPASMPEAHIRKVAAAVTEIVRAPEMRARLFQQGWQVIGAAPEGLRHRIQIDTQALGDIIRRQNIQQ